MEVRASLMGIPETDGGPGGNIDPPALREVMT